MTPEAINLAITEIVGAKRDYFGCLNAMAEARKTLVSDTQRSRYFEALHQVVGPISDNPQWAMIDASAERHAEAFLITIREMEKKHETP